MNQKPHVHVHFHVHVHLGHRSSSHPPPPRRPSTIDASLVEDNFPTSAPMRAVFPADNVITFRRAG